MSKKDLAAERFSQLEKEVTDAIEGRVSVDSLSEYLGKKFNDFARDIEYGRVPTSYIKKTNELTERVLNYCRRGATN